MSKLLDAFHVEKKVIPPITTDYDIFKDKELLEEIRKKVLESLSKKGLDKSKIAFDIIEQEVLDQTYSYHLTSGEKNYIYHIIESELTGYGPLSELLKDDNITEIMVNNPKDIYIETDGIIKKDESVSFINEEHILRIVEKLLQPTGKVLDIHHPMVDVILEDGSRMNVMIPPIAKAPVVTIRKFQHSIASMDTLVGNGALTPYMARFLEAAVKAKLNIIICGGAGSGKTTLLHILSNFIPEEERIITIEEVRELNLHQRNVVSLETSATKIDNKSSVSIHDLIENSLRMHPDRLVIGEIKGEEAYSLLQAMNTGHVGSLTTMHANHPKDALHRLETMILMNGLEIPIEALRDYMSGAIDVLVHMDRMCDGKRKIIAISEIVSLEDGEFVLNDIFTFKTEGVAPNGMLLGEFALLNKKPSCLQKIINAGITDIKDIFKKQTK